MNTELTLLDEDKFSSFLKEAKTVVRICHKKTGWFFGICQSVKFDGNTCRLHLKIFRHSKRTVPTRQDDFEEFNGTLLSDQDQPDGPVVENERRSFIFKDPQRVIRDTHAETHTFIIRADGESAVLSHRMPDIATIEEFLTIKI